MTDHGIAGKAHDLVYGERAKTYGHPRLDFNIIANVWTGLLKDKLQEGATLDPYRVAVMMTGLKLARLVKSPEHTDSRIDTIGYMLTMERLDEEEDFFVEDETEEERAKAWEKGEPVTAVTERPYEGWKMPLPNLWRLREESEREIDKFLGRETAEHSAELDKLQDEVHDANCSRSERCAGDKCRTDAPSDQSVDGPLTSVHHPLNVLLRGFGRVEDIEWQEGDRVERWKAYPRQAWLYGSVEDLWYEESRFDPDNTLFQPFNSYLLEYLRENFAPLRVTTGTYKGLLLFKDGVGYGPE